MEPQASSRFARRTDQVTVCYLAATAALAVLFRESLSGWLLFVAAHLLGCLALAALPRLSPRSLPTVRFLRHWYPFLLFPILYKEVEVFAGAFGNWGLTDPVRALEVSLFDGHPSLYMSERLSWVPLSEFLHFCYLSYVVMIPAIAGYWYGVGRHVAFRELVLLLSVTMYGSYLFFILLPVDSPFYLAQPLGPPLAGQFFFDLVHAVSERGGARGGAFPSAHVSGAVIVWLVTWRYQRRLAYVLAPVVVGIIVATVYGRFHYAVDTIAGFALALLVVTVFRMTTDDPFETSWRADPSPDPSAGFEG